MEITVNIKGPQYNIIGLTNGQAELYRYILKCSTEQKEVEMDNICIIYYTHVATKVRSWYDGKNGDFQNGLEYFESKKRHLKEINYSQRYAYESPRNWLKQNLGSFVLRGLLAVIPKFNPEEVKE